VMRVINFAHGEFLALGMYLTLWLFRATGLDPFLAIPIVVLAGGAWGWVTNQVLVGPMARGPEKGYIRMTLGIGLVISNGLLLGFGAHPQSIYPSYSTATFQLAGVSFSLPLTLSFAITVVVIAALYGMLNRTELGRAIRATAQNPVAAELQGIDTQRVRNAVFAIGVALASLAGVLLLPVLYVIPTVGSVVTRKAFVVTVLGGMGKDRKSGGQETREISGGAG